MKRWNSHYFLESESVPSGLLGFAQPLRRYCAHCCSKWKCENNNLFVQLNRSLPKLASHDDDEGNNPNQYLGVGTFEPIPHDHDFCERVVINVSGKPSITTTRAMPMSLCPCVRVSVCLRVSVSECVCTACVCMSVCECAPEPGSRSLRINKPACSCNVAVKSRTQHIHKQTCWKDKDHMDKNHNNPVLGQTNPKRKQK